jgi:hypothetical protein
VSKFVWSQCTPNQGILELPAGVYPDTSINLPTCYGTNVNGYTAELNIKTLTEYEYSSPPISALLFIEAFQLTGISGLPAGFSYTTNTPIWYNGGVAPSFTPTIGCVSITASTTSILNVLSQYPTGIEIPITLNGEALVNSCIPEILSPGVAGQWYPYDYSGYVLRILPSNSWGEINSFTTEITYAFDPNALTFSTPPAGCSNYTYQWYSHPGLVDHPNSYNTGDWAIIPGATSATYNPPALFSSTSFACFVTPSNNCLSGKWAEGVVKFDIPTSYGTINSEFLIQCSLENIALQLDTNSYGMGDVSYQWYFRMNNDTCPQAESSLQGWSIISGANSPSSSFQPNTPGQYTFACYVDPISANGIPAKWAEGCKTINVVPPVNIPQIQVNGLPSSCSSPSPTLTLLNTFQNFSWNTGETTSSISANQSGDYYVEVIDANGCVSQSSVTSVNCALVSPVSICVATIDSLTGHNIIVWEKPITALIDSFIVYKETSIANEYSRIGSQPYAQLSTFIDVSSNALVQSNRYKLSVRDTCGVESTLSPNHKTMHLTLNVGVGGTVNLIWDGYEGINFGSYNIYRGTSPENMSLLTTIQSSLTSYTDLLPPSGTVYYQMEIVIPGCNPTAISFLRSLSNIANVVNTGVEDLLLTDVRIFPNPTSMGITLQSAQLQAGEDLQLLDQVGRVVLSTSLQGASTFISTSTLASGIYFIRLPKHPGFSRKIVVQ